jgi:integrase
MQGFALEVVARLCKRAKAAHSLRLWCLAPSSINYRWCHDRRRMGLPDEIHIHDLRHGFISVLANSGTPLPVVQRLAGHADLSTTARYIHDDPAALRAAMRARADAVQK